jgi:UDP-N-acetylglucosamine--N-acetylmuramyl-(pentapeptide) pyrophosphoryl-undecaprenol N-acetylglucosamine transferase
MRIKTVIHESNVAPGLVTRILGPKCDKLPLNLDGTRKHFKKTENTVVVGNPTRKGFSDITKSDAKQKLNIPKTKKLIVSFGGSLGSEVLNGAILEFMKNTVLKRSDIYHIHATGRQYYNHIRSEHHELFKNQRCVRVLPYIEDMPTVLKAADVAITRSGAITISELARCATPSILIPSPNVTANHQFINAEYMRQNGAALLIEEKDLTCKRLQSDVMSILGSDEVLRKMSYCASTVSSSDTDVLIAEAIGELSDS